MSATSQKISAWLLVILLPVAGYVGWNAFKKVKQAGSDSGENTVETAEAPVARTGRLLSEEHWIVDETTRGITEMLAFAKDPAKRVTFTAQTRNEAPRPDQSRAYDLEAKLGGNSITGAFTAKEYIWSPADHLPWAQQLVGEWKLTAPAASATPADFVVALTKATPEVLQSEGKRLSAALSQAPLDAALHDQAALVTLAFAMHEAAKEYTDIRREMSRAAAHLAIARALRPASKDVVRLLAESALLTLAGREVPALAALANVPAEAAGAGAWVQTLRLRTTGNWKTAGDPTTLLETIEIFRARARSVDSHFAVAWAESKELDPVHDFRRIVLENGFGVQDGHEFAHESLQEEIASLQADYQNFHGAALEQKDALKALNEPASGAVVAGTDGRNAIRVLGWDFWSAQHQRHLCDSMRATNIFLRDKWGVPEFRELQKFAKLNFSNLALFPLLERDLSEDARDFAATANRVKALTNDHPELVPPSAWAYARMTTDRTRLPALDVSTPGTWFNPLLPFGTVHDIERRVSGFNLPGGGDRWWARLIELAPSNYSLRYGQTWKTYGEVTPVAAAEKAYGPLQDYHLLAMRKIAQAQKTAKSPKYPETMERIAQVDAGFYFELGNWYLARDEKEKAAEAYQKGVDLCEDRVQASNNASWLVNYLEDQGLGDRALAIATMAAEVYSYRGLETMARLMERRGQLKEAEGYYEKIVERYEKSDLSGPLAAFYTRHRSKDPEFEKKTVSLEGRLFPDGLKKVTLADFQGAPAGGTTLLGFSAHMQTAELRKTDVIVALDGYQCLDHHQYTYIRELSPGQPLQLIVWDGAGYREVTANPPERMLGVKIGDYKKP